MNDARPVLNFAQLPGDVAGSTDILLNSDTWVIGIPRTAAATRWWGQQSGWCTASDLGAYWYYKDRGPLLVFMRREDGKRWQLHPTTGEFRDEWNRRASWRGFIGQNPSVLAAIMEVFAVVGPMAVVDAASAAG